MKKFPWEQAMEIGLGRLRLAPQDFWRMTLAELAAAARGVGLAHARVSAIRRTDLEALTRRFPD
ncbi:MAG TPA: phage tail assembly chaperone [Parvibaculum sp.]|uniref:rcc01693 family protein n=1 Tax=Parvibaculum sp. TaxID=2024848 RepID=UPI002CD68F73|nr:rcc01693 family protein [Parvibaculum sp.]HMM15370.1 phage tail assembly chaperone [Parvibaculum sp.]